MQILTGGDTATCPDNGDVLTALTVGESDREPCRRVRGIGTGDAANKYAVKAVSIRLEKNKATAKHWPVSGINKWLRTNVPCEMSRIITDNGILYVILEIECPV